MSADGRYGLTTATSIVVASMIGVGVFATSGYALAALGDPWLVLLAWGTGGVLAVLGALCYGALARRLPESGGEYLFLGRTLHPSLGFLAGWLSLCAGFTAPMATAAIAFQEYVGPLFGVAPDRPWLATVALVVAGAVHLRAGIGAGLQNAIVAAKVAALVALSIFGLAALPEPEARPAAPFAAGAFATTLMWISMSYSGWNAAVYLAGEVRGRRRVVPRALLIGTLVVTALYLALNAVFVFAAPYEVIAGREDVAAVAVAALFGTGWERGLRVLVGVALFTSLTSMAMVGPRVYAKMADDGVFPRFFAEARNVPVAAITLQVALAVAVAWLGDLRALLGYVGFTLALSTALAVVGLVVLRRREGAAAVPVPGWPWVPVVFVVATVVIAVLMAVHTAKEPAVSVVTVLVGLLLWAWQRRRRR